MTQNTFIALIVIFSGLVLWLAEPTPCGSYEKCNAEHTLGVSQQEQY